MRWTSTVFDTALNPMTSLLTPLQYEIVRYKWRKWKGRYQNNIFFSLSFFVCRRRLHCLFLTWSTFPSAESLSVTLTTVYNIGKCQYICMPGSIVSGIHSDTICKIFFLLVFISTVLHHKSCEKKETIFCAMVW